MPPSSVPHHAVPPPEMQPQIQYAQQVHYQNGQMQSQVHYAVQPPQPHFEQNSDIPDHHKGQGVKRRFSDVDGAPVSTIGIVYEEQSSYKLFFYYL